MCEEQQVAAMGRAARRIDRRGFTALSATAGFGGMIAACAPTNASSAGAQSLAERAVSFAAPGGTMDGVFIHPGEGAHPGVILWPDIAGLRPAKVEMGRRLAREGYAVFVANPYYRSVAGQQFADFDAWRAADGFAKVAPWREQNTPEHVMETARALVGWLDAQQAVDTTRGIGNQGYCMTGGWTLMTAAAVPSRVKAAASFHGGGLVGDGPLAPVNLFDDLAEDAQVLIAIARDDHAKAPDDLPRLRAAAEAAGVPGKIEVYDGDHGWTVLDSPAYAEAAADRAWADLLALYSGTL